jgi:hypothetical protein
MSPSSVRQKSGTRDPLERLLDYIEYRTKGDRIQQLYRGAVQVNLKPQTSCGGVVRVLLHNEPYRSRLSLAQIEVRKLIGQREPERSRTQK